MQNSRAAGRRERDELVGIEPGSINHFPKFEGTINRMQVNFDNVIYAEEIINSTMHASPNRKPNIRYLLSIGLQFSFRQPWNHGSIIPSEFQFIIIVLKLVNMKEEQLLIFRQINIQNLFEWVNLSQYQRLVRNKTIEEKWPLVLYPTDEEGRFSIQSRCNDINAGRHYFPPDYYKNNLSAH